LQRFISEGRARDVDGRNGQALVRTVGRWFAIAVALGAAVLSGLLLALPGHAPGPWWLPAVLMILMAFESLGACLLSGSLRFALMAKIAIGSAMLQLTAVGIGLHWGGVVGGALGYGAISAPLACYGLSVLARSAGLPEPAQLRQVVGFAASIWFTSLASSFVWMRMELYYISYYADAHAVALYAMGLTWVALVSQPPLMLLGALVPHMSAQIGRGDHASAFRTYRQATILLSLVLMPVCLCAAALTPILLPLIFGVGYTDAVPCATVLAASGMWLSMSAGSSLFYAMARSRILVVSSILGVIIALSVCLAVVPTGGILGAAWARFGLQGVMVSIGAWCIQVLVGCPVPIRALALIALSATLSAMALYGASTWWGWLGALAAFPLVLLAYGFMIKSMGVLSSDDSDTVRSLIRSLGRHIGLSASAQAGSGSRSGSTEER
jgi:O-antigen/teichoic acid export membrane protein